MISDIDRRFLTDLVQNKINQENIKLDLGILFAKAMVGRIARRIADSVNLDVDVTVLNSETEIHLKWLEQE